MNGLVHIPSNGLTGLYLACKKQADNRVGTLHSGQPDSAIRICSPLADVRHDDSHLGTGCALAPLGGAWWSERDRHLEPGDPRGTDLLGIFPTARQARPDDKCSNEQRRNLHSQHETDVSATPCSAPYELIEVPVARRTVGPVAMPDLRRGQVGLEVHGIGAIPVTSPLAALGLPLPNNRLRHVAGRPERISESVDVNCYAKRMVRLQARPSHVAVLIAPIIELPCGYCGRVFGCARFEKSFQAQEVAACSAMDEHASAEELDLQYVSPYEPALLGTAVVLERPVRRARNLFGHGCGGFLTTAQHPRAHYEQEQHSTDDGRPPPCNSWSRRPAGGRN